MKVADSLLNVPVVIVTLSSNVAEMKRRRCIGLWLGCLAGILALGGCGHKVDRRSEAGGVAVL